MMMQGHKNSVLELHWTADGDNLLTCSPDKTLRLWDATTGESVKCMKGHQSFVNACSVAPKGKPLCVSGSDDGTAKRISAPEGAINFNMGTLVGSYASVARMLDECATVPATKGIMLTFDDFLIGLEQFGERIQPLMKTRAAKLKQVA